MEGEFVPWKASMFTMEVDICYKRQICVVKDDLCALREKYEKLGSIGPLSTIVGLKICNN